MPKNESELASFKRLLEQPCKSLEQKLEMNLGLSKYCAEYRISKDALSSHIESIPSAFAMIRRREILKQAREILLLDYHNTMIASGDALEDELSSAGDIGDPKALLDQSGSFAMQKLKFDSCQVSLASCRLLKFIHEVMKQACTASTDVANVLFHSARDCLEMFLAIVPTKFAEIIETVPRMGAVYFNDCLYLAHNTILLTHRYRQEMGKKDEVLQGSIGFVDFIPRFKKAAEKCMEQHINEQYSVLKEMIERIRITPQKDSNEEVRKNPKNILVGGLQMAGKLKNRLMHSGTAEAAEEAAAQESFPEAAKISMEELEDDGPQNNESRAGMLLAQLDRLSTQWMGVLQDDVYGRVIGVLVERVLQDAMKPVLAADCITVSSANDISRIFKIIQQCRTLLPVVPDEQGSSEAYHRLVPVWEKFAALTDILEYNLNDIADGLSRKRFASFTASEMIKLIKALFEDTPRRQSLLVSIEAVNIA